MSIRQKGMMFLIISFALGLFGCSISQIIPATQQELAQIEKSRIFNKDFALVWASVVKTISEKGYTTLSQDKSSGSISTDFKVTKEAFMMSAGRRHKLNVFVEKKSDSQTQVTITPVFQVRHTDKAEWAQIHGGRTAETIHVEREFLDAVQKNM